jgi:hypothetical protein
MSQSLLAWVLKAIFAAPYENAPGQPVGEGQAAVRIGDGG